MTMAPTTSSVSSTRPAIATAVACGDEGVAGGRAAIPGMPSMPGIGPVISGSAVCGVTTGVGTPVATPALGAPVVLGVGWAGARSTKLNLPSIG
jgi:hypothetical protein